MKKGNYHEVVGGYFGAYYDGREWIGFECSGCLFAQGILDPRNRVGGQPSKSAWNAMNDRKSFKHHHDKEIHNEWLSAGKPKKW